MEARLRFTVLLGIYRSADVYAIKDGTRVFPLSETTVREHIEEDPDSPRK
jgi:hypothetical protein